MTVVLGILGAALLFGLFTVLRPGDRPGGGCTGQCAGCTRDGACRSEDSGALR
jgi:hypothetical protein